MDLVINAEISPVSGSGDLSNEWQDLESRADCRFFLSWGWMKPWLDELAEEAYVIRARRDGVLVGLGLFSIREEPRLKLFRARVAYLNQTGVPGKDMVTLEYNGFLLDKNCAAEAQQACLDELVSSRNPAWDELYIHNAPQKFIMELQYLGLDRRDVASAPSAEVDLEKVRQAENYISTLGRNTRQQIRRSIRLYEKRHGDLGIARAASAEEALEWFQQAGELHQARWASRNLPGVLSFPDYQKMHSALIRAAHGAGPEAGCAEILRIFSGEYSIGYLYNFLYRGRVYFYLSGLQFDPDPKLKPGLVTHALAIEMHAEEGRDIYDFMAGENRYKINMGQEMPALTSLYLRKPRLLVSLENRLRAVKARLVAR